MEQKKAVAVITARGGSKRIPRKNIRQFCGKPIMEYPIRAALKSGIFDEVMVSTDDEEIAEIAKRAGAKVPFMRSSLNAGDMAASHEVVLEVLEEYKKAGILFEYVCCIYPTAPFLTAEKLQKSLKALEDGVSDGVIPVVAYSFPPQRSFIIKNDKVEFKWPENRLKRSQDLETFYHDSGQFYFLRVKEFLVQQTMLLQNTMPLILNEMEVQDIDNEEDWKLAELKYQIRAAEREN